MKKRLIIGVTGGIATGKSTVMDLLAQQGIRGISSDALAHQAIRKGTPAFKKIVRAFGRNILGSDGQIDRQKLAAVVFPKPNARKRLERIVHPEVVRGLKAFVRKHPGVLALDIPLLFEARLQKLVDHIVVVAAPQKQQMSRLLKRNRYTRAQALERIRAQWPQYRKMKAADTVFWNAGTLARLKKQVRHWTEITLDS